MRRGLGRKDFAGKEPSTCVLPFLLVSKAAFKAPEASSEPEPAVASVLSLTPSLLPKRAARFFSRQTGRSPLVAHYSNTLTTDAPLTFFEMTAVSIRKVFAPSTNR